MENNIQSISTDSPTVYFGWLGCHENLKADGIRWFTQGLGSSYYNSIAPSTSGNSYFTNITDCQETDNYIFVLDNGLLRVFENKSYKPLEISFPNITDYIQEFVFFSGEFKVLCQLDPHPGRALRGHDGQLHDGRRILDTSGLAPLPRVAVTSVGKLTRFARDKK